MALSKKSKKKNGLELQYHRISSIHFDVNKYVEITVHSYLNKEARQYEKDCHNGLVQGEVEYPYIYYETYVLEYDENMTIKKAYQWLKKNEPDLADAEDI